MLIAAAMRIVKDPQVAEDLAQETYLRTRKAMDAGPIEHLEAFLYLTAKNLALDHRRRRHARGGVVRAGGDHPDIANIPSDTPDPEVALIERERLRRLENAVRRLPERARRVWVLARLEGWTYPQIARHLGISQGTVFNDLKLAMGQCRDAVERLERD